MNLKVSASPIVSESTRPRSRFPKFIAAQQASAWLLNAAYTTGISCEWGIGGGGAVFRAEPRATGHGVWRPATSLRVRHVKFAQRGGAGQQRGGRADGAVGENRSDPVCSRGTPGTLARCRGESFLRKVRVHGLAAWPLPLNRRTVLLRHFLTSVQVDASLHFRFSTARAALP